MIRSPGGAGAAMRRAIGIAATATIALGSLGPTLTAQAADAGACPNRAIRIVVPAAAGAADLPARVVGAKLADALGQAVTIENRPGGSYNIASDIVAKAPADGYTLLFTTSVITLLPSTLGKVAVDPLTSFAPITKLAGVPLVIVAHPSLGVATLHELLALARQRPGRIAYATQGVGTIAHMTATMIAQRAGVELLHIPYVNTGQALKDVPNGEVPVYFSFRGTIDAPLSNGQLRGLAVASTRRMQAWPDIPTVVELGFSEAAVDPWYGVLAPAGTPPEIVDRLYGELANIIRQPDIRERFAQLGMELVGSTPEQFAAEIRGAVARWPAIVKAAGFRAE